MTISKQPPAGTLVLINRGTYRGWVGRIDRYTPSRVWFCFLETNDKEPTDGEGIIDQTNFYQLKAHHAHSAPYPELRKRPHAARGRSHPLRHTVIDPVIAHTSASGNSRIEMEAILLALNDHLATQHPTKDSSS
jgi:hypothetical protein